MKVGWVAQLLDKVNIDFERVREKDLRRFFRYFPRDVTPCDNFYHGDSQTLTLFIFYGAASVECYWANKWCFFLEY